MSRTTTLILMGCEPTEGEFPYERIKDGQAEAAFHSAVRLALEEIGQIDRIHHAPDAPITETATAFMNGYRHTMRGADDSGEMPEIEIAWRLCGTDLDEEWPSELERELLAAAAGEPDAGSHAAIARTMFEREEFREPIRRRAAQAFAYFAEIVKSHPGETIVVIGTRLLSGLNSMLGDDATHRTEHWAFQTGEMRVVEVDATLNVTDIKRFFRAGFEPSGD